MGSTTFWDTGEGSTAQEAFNVLRDQAAWEYGHGGYTGTIAEKGEFVLLTPPGPLPEGWTLHKLSEHLLNCDYARPCDTVTYVRNEETRRWEDVYTEGVFPESWKVWLQRAYDTVDDKWGPAGCFSLGGNKWLFFGWASE